MTSRLKLETGAREEDERDDTPRGGLFHRNERTHDRHRSHPGWHVSRQDGSIQDGTKARDLNAHYHAEHGKEHDQHHDTEQWLEDRLGQAEDRIGVLEAQHEFIAKVLAELLDRGACADAADGGA